MNIEHLKKEVEDAIISYIHTMEAIGSTGNPFMSDDDSKEIANARQKIDIAWENIFKFKIKYDKE